MARPAAKLRQPHELFSLALQACLIAHDAALNTAEMISHRSTFAHVTVKQCERELDLLERQIDQEVAGAITRVGENEARELLAARRLITELERIGDLLWKSADRLRPLLRQLPQQDAEQLVAMSTHVRTMLEAAHAGLRDRDTGQADRVIRTDAKVDKLCRAVFQRYVLADKPENPHDAITIVLAAQALERAGDHAVNVGEVILHLVERRSVLHRKKHTLELH